jgi:hypothetical protein
MFADRLRRTGTPQLSKRRHSVAHLESALKETIARGARRQVRFVLSPLRRELLRLRKKVTELQATVMALRQSANGWKRVLEGAPPVPHVSEEDAKAARLSPRLIRSLRVRLGLSQSALARLGVRAPAVAHWEAGNSAPTGQKPCKRGGSTEGGEARGQGVARSAGQEDVRRRLFHLQASRQKAR